MDPTGVIAIVSIFLGLPWIIFHYITKWKSAATLTTEDENLLDGLHEMARRLEDRLSTIERIMSAENPGWRTVTHDPVASLPVRDLGEIDRDLEELRSLRK
ncbi:envelope stress response membrane protein PspB [Allosphingosinicella flava]|uniref:Envelope stress response membrane protein PspB n=1 Tax=Allosphingosinicella flava TaxID=2771430 RepID=A0A7T2LMQ6_9SPHN|nr:envelope stress response membrane protein PspB [Sphingosinicella flava]QPQ55811.1 envelope stress response membrane protein PspB [Sphingosinicella flava]